MVLPESIADGVRVAVAPGRKLARPDPKRAQETRVRCLQAGKSYSRNRARKERTMTGKADFTDEEWQLILEGPPTAGLIVVASERGGTFRETFEIAKVYAEARHQHGESQLLDEIVAARPECDHTFYHSHEEMKEAGLAHLRDAVSLLEQKATPQEVEDYRSFVLTLADRVGHAHREQGESLSEAEKAAIEEIRSSLGEAA
jgi:hypothetical protein